MNTKKKVFAKNWSGFSPKLDENQKKSYSPPVEVFLLRNHFSLLGNLILYSAGICRSFRVIIQRSILDGRTPKSRWGDAKSRWGDAFPLQFKFWLGLNYANYASGKHNITVSQPLGGFTVRRYPFFVSFVRFCFFMKKFVLFRPHFYMFPIRTN